MMAVTNKSLVLMYFLLAIATSQADAACIDVCIKNFAVSPSATARDVVAGCTAKCALVENQRKTINALLAPKTDDYKRTEAALVEEEEKLPEELISLNDQLKKVNCPSTTAQTCYDRCRATPQRCAKLCGCKLIGTEAAVVEKEEEKLTEELISLNDQLKKVNCPSTTAQNCYNICRMTPQACAKRCGCTLEGTKATVVDEEEEELTGELIKPTSDCPTTAARNCYNACRFLGTSQQRCAKLCSCKLIGTEAAAVEKEEEKLTEELIRPDSKCPTTTARNCYNVCRFAGSSRPRCAKLCGCKLIGTEAAAVEKHELAAKI